MGQRVWRFRLWTTSLLDGLSVVCPNLNSLSVSSKVLHIKESDDWSLLYPISNQGFATLHHELQQHRVSFREVTESRWLSSQLRYEPWRRPPPVREECQLWTSWWRIKRKRTARRIDSASVSPRTLLRERLILSPYRSISESALRLPMRLW